MSIDKSAKTTSAENFMEPFPIPENGVKKTKTPRNFDSIIKGALALSLEERVQLKNGLLASIRDEVETKKKEAADAEKISQE